MIMRYKMFDFDDEDGRDDSHVTLSPSWSDSSVILYNSPTGRPVDTAKIRFKYDKVNDVYLRVSKHNSKIFPVLIIPETSKYFNFDFIQFISPVRHLIRNHPDRERLLSNLQAIERELKTIGNNLLNEI